MLHLSDKYKTLKTAIMATFLATFLILSGLSGLPEARAESEPFEERHNYQKLKIDYEIVNDWPFSHILTETEADNYFKTTFNYCGNVLQAGGCAYDRYAEWEEGIFYDFDNTNAIRTDDDGLFRPSPALVINKNMFTGDYNLNIHFLKDDDDAGEMRGLSTDGNSETITGDWYDYTGDYILKIREIIEPEPETLEAENVTHNSASLRGTYTGLDDLDGWSFRFDTYRNTTRIFKGSEFDLTTPPVGVTVSGLKTGTSYAYHLIIINEETGEEYPASFKHFTTKEEADVFDGFEAFNLPPEEYSLNDYILGAEVLDFGTYNFEGTDNHLARGIEVFDSDGQLIRQPAKQIINDFQTPAEYDYLFTAEDGQSYGYRWSFAYVDYETGQTLQTYQTDLDTFTHQVDEEAPDIETRPAVDITHDSAELRGRVNHRGDYSDLNVSFEWAEHGAEDWNETGTVATLDGSYNYPATVWDIIDNLEEDTRYIFRIKAEDYRGSVMAFTTGKEPIDDPDPPPPEDWEDWPDFYNLQSNGQFSQPVGVIDTIGGTFNGMMTAITNRIEPFTDRIQPGQAYSHGRKAGEFIPTMRGYLIELRPFFGGLPVAEVFLFFLIFEVAILGIKGVMIALGFLPFF